jgi:DNA-binding GntR family transcriptional regulator
MSPTVFRLKGYRFFFFSREEARMHVQCPDGEAKFWLEPIVALAAQHGLSPRQLAELQRITEEKRHEIAKAWKTHFAG